MSQINTMKLDGKEVFWFCLQGITFISESYHSFSFEVMMDIYYYELIKVVDNIFQCIIVFRIIYSKYILSTMNTF